MRSDKKKMAVIIAIVTALITITVYHLAGKLIDNVIADELLSKFLSECVFAGIVFIAVILLKQTALFHSDIKYLKSGWMSAGLLILMIIYFGLSSIEMIFESDAKAGRWVLLFGLVFLVGFAEEVLFRGLIQRAFHRLFGEDSFKNVFLAVFLTGLVFGLCHLINLDRGNPPLAAITQATANVFMGTYYCAVYYRTGKNIWYMTVLHALYDCTAMLSDGIMNGGTVDEVLNVGGGSASIGGVFLTALVYGVIFMSLTLFVLRPKKLKPLLSEGQTGQPQE